MATIYQHLMDFINEGSDPRNSSLPLIASPFSVVGILSFYYCVVFKLGPQLMKSREPFNLKYIMIFYNISQILINGYIWIMSIIIIILTRHNMFCQEVDYSDDPVAVVIAFHAWIFFLIKILDLMDTVWMVLRKNERQITFLHVYHHAGMVLVSWIGAKYVPGGHGLICPNVNSFVHCCMYFYYLLTVLNPEYKKSIWWKKHLTELQMVQFVIMALHMAFALLNPNCNYPRSASFSFMLQNILVFLMFWEFYKKNYICEKKIYTENNNSKESNGTKSVKTA